jgi:hypothetical protein
MATATACAATREVRSSPEEYPLPQPDDLRALMARHGLKSLDLAAMAGVNAATARRWIKDPGPGYIPIPADAWERIRKAVGE